MKYLEKRRNKWYAVLTIPQDVRHEFGGKMRFVKSTGTADQRKAQQVAYALVAGWKEQIEIARGQPEGCSPSVLELALETRRARITAAEDSDLESIDAGAEAIIEHFALRGMKQEAQLFSKVTFGNTEPISSYLGEWQESLHLEQKTIDQMVKDAKLMANFFPTVDDVTGERVRDWAKWLMADKREGGKGYSLSSVKRTFTAARSVWRYLQEMGKAPLSVEPFKLPSFVTASARKREKEQIRTTGSGKGWLPFEPSDVVLLLRGAEAKGDQSLVDLIRLGMYTGARIEELCSLRVEYCSSSVLRITDSKTEAGLREVPVHSAIREHVARLIEESADGFLLSGLKATQYGERSGAVGKRFGRLKKRLGYSEKHVFHSIRKTVVTLFENAGVRENLAADIVGHDKPNITYGVYSGGHTLEEKRQAVELIRYP